jgi:CDGSH-type Zn-finger protein
VRMLSLALRPVLLQDLLSIIKNIWNAILLCKCGESGEKGK